MFHHDSWKFVYFEVKISKVKVTRHKKASAYRRNAILPLAACVSYAGFFPAAIPPLHKPC